MPLAVLFVAAAIGAALWIARRNRRGMFAGDGAAPDSPDGDSTPALTLDTGAGAAVSDAPGAAVGGDELDEDYIAGDLDVGLEPAGDPYLDPAGKTSTEWAADKADVGLTRGVVGYDYSPKIKPTRTGGPKGGAI